MRRTQSRAWHFPAALLSFSRPAGFVAVLLWASRSVAQVRLKNPAASRTHGAGRLVVHLPGRNLVLLKDGHGVKVDDGAVGAHLSPRPGGEFQIDPRLCNPTYYKPSVVGWPRCRKSAGHARQHSQRQVIRPSSAEENTNGNHVSIRRIGNHHPRRAAYCTGASNPSASRCVRFDAAGHDAPARAATGHRTGRAVGGARL
jgi:hypothetical protein